MTFVPKKGSKVQNRFPRVEHVAAHLELLMCDFDRKRAALKGTGSKNLDSITANTYHT